MSTPIKGVYDGLGNATGIAEFISTDTIPIINGGTGQSTANASFNALAPSQSTHTGQALITDGTNTSWGSATVNIPVLIYSYNTVFSTDQTTITTSSSAYTATLLNTEVLDTGALGTLSTNTISLAAGKYLVDFTVQYGSPDATPSGLIFRLRNTSDSTTAIAGVGGAIFNGGAGGAGVAVGHGYINIAATKNFQIQHILVGDTGTSYFIGTRSSNILNANIGNREPVQIRFTKIG